MQRQIVITTFIVVIAVFGYSMSEKAKEPAPSKSQPTVSGKSLGYFQSTLWSEENGNGDVNIHAKVVARKDMPNAKFEWKTPSGLQLFSGERNGDVSLTSGQEMVFSIVVDKEQLKDQDQFFFFVYENVDGEKHGTSQSYIYDLNDVSKSQLKSKQQPKPPKYYE